MAEKDVDIDDLVQKFGDFCECTDLVKKDRTKFSTKACNRLVQDALKKDFGKLEISQRVDSSVYPKCKPKGAKDMPVNKDTVQQFVHLCAWEMAKKKKKNEKLSEDDAAVSEVEEKIKSCIRASAPISTATKQSKSGGVGRMTDASKYTGAHKERFGADGKGKGIEGRKDIHANEGYTGQYKGKGTYDKK